MKRNWNFWRSGLGAGGGGVKVKKKPSGGGGVVMDSFWNNTIMIITYLNNSQVWPAVKPGINTALCTNIQKRPYPLPLSLWSEML